MAGTAFAVPAFEFEDTDPRGNHRAGKIESVYARYDAENSLLSWETTLSRHRGQLYNGFWLVISDGPNPKRHVDEYAILYGDAVNNRLTAYVYDGKNSARSWRRNPFIHSYEGVLNVSNDARQRSIGFSDLDVSIINEFIDSPAWDGVAFGEQIGVWFHPVLLKRSRYLEDGALSRFRYKRQGWYDIANHTAYAVPAPGSQVLLLVALMGLILVTAGLRKKQKLPIKTKR